MLSDALERVDTPLGVEDLEAEALSVLARAIGSEFKNRIALVSSFGAESVVLLHLVSQIDRDLSILFNETGMLFAETLSYQRRVAEALGLTNVQLVRPHVDDVTGRDPVGALHRVDADACCHLRKVEPMERALQPFSAWITGRKRFQADSRRSLAPRELDGAGRTKLNPLASWQPEDLRDYMQIHDLPRHPLVAQGYASIGCAPCTSKVLPGEDSRAGRWRNQDKSECGLHLVGGKLVPAAASV